jgi:hypothetical protein
MQPSEWVGVTVPFRWITDAKGRPVRAGKRWLTVRLPADRWPGALRGFDCRESASSYARRANDGR